MITAGASVRYSTGDEGAAITAGAGRNVAQGLVQRGSSQALEMYSVMQVTQQSLWVHGMLRSVEDVIKGVVFEEGQSSLYGGLRALVATTWQFYLLACRALRVRERRIALPGTVDVVIAAHVHEVGRCDRSVPPTSHHPLPDAR